MTARTLWTLLISAFWLSIPAGSLPGAERLNVLFITSDDLGPMLSCYGNQVIETPHLDRLAARSTQFEVAYVAQASCSPSRSAMFTGLYPHATGQYGLTGNADSPSGFALHEHLRDRTIPALLKQAGFRTGIIGKLHVAPEDEFPFDVRPTGVNTRSVRTVARSAREFFSTSADQPFFLMVNYSDPHATRDSQEVGGWHFEAQIDGLPVNPLKPGDAPPWPFQLIDEPLQLERVANYYNCIQRLDAGIGLLLEELADSGHDEDTLIIFCGDHGPPFCRGKTTVYEAGVRVPFLVAWPGVSRPMKSAAMVSTVDILPTILDAVGLDAPADLHGRSLRPVVSEPDAPWREYLVAEFHFHGTSPFYPRRGIRNARYHLIHNQLAGRNRPSNGIDGDQAMKFSQLEKYAGTPARRAFDTFADPPEFELYDLQQDSAELNNLAGAPQLAAVEEELKLALRHWQEETHDILLDPAMVQKLDTHRPPGSR
jgi:N-sulfoglucosamine sulfohydrolase